MMPAQATLAGLLGEVSSMMAKAGVEEPRREARLLVEHACRLSRSRQLAEPQQKVPAAAADRLMRVAERRAGGEPFARIAGVCEFWSLEFAVGPATLVPRPDSETVVSAALEQVADRHAPLRLLDLGTGTGCLLLALLNELPRARGTGIDIAAAAVEVARGNAERLGLARRAGFAAGDWVECDLPVADLLVANPPYIPRHEIPALAPEVAQHDPRVALDGGREGLEAYRSIAAHLHRWLRPDGAAVLEIGRGQQAGVSAIFAEAGWAITAMRRDLGGIPRALVLRRAGAGENEKELGNDR
jgi:release factor glutamine methyltransferase